MLTNQIYLSYGQRPQQMIGELLEAIDLAGMIPPGAQVGLKPNLVVARPSHEGATTSPELVEGVIQYLHRHQHTNLVIAEGSWIGDSTTKAFMICGYTKLAKKYNVPLVDLQKDAFYSQQVGDLELKICQTMAEIDFLINLPVLKGHCQTKITCALKNLKGCIPDQEKRRFHSLGLHKPIAYLNQAITTDLIVVDGLMGDLDFEEGGNPVQMDRIIVGTDPVLIDSYVATLLGYGPEEISYLNIAAELGIGEIYNSATELNVLNSEHTVGRIRATRAVEHLAKFVVEKEACSACYGSLIHALGRLNDRGLLGQANLAADKISIGQGFKGQQGEGIGVGVCTRNFVRNLGGCPPSAKEIVDFLQEYW